MIAYLRKPHADLAALILRLGLGFLFIAHGYSKIIQDFKWTEVISPAMQQTVGWAELIFGILLLIGLLGRLAALGVIGDMIGAIVLVTGRRGIIGQDMGPHGLTFQASGFEYNFLIIAACLALLVLGSGWFSLDHLIFCRRKCGTTAVGMPPPRSENAVSSPLRVGEG